MKLALLLGSWSHYQQSFHVSHNFLYPSSSLLLTSDTRLREEWCKTYLSEGPSTTKLGRTKQNEILNSSIPFSIDSLKAFTQMRNARAYILTSMINGVLSHGIILKVEVDRELLMFYWCGLGIIYWWDRWSPSWWSCCCYDCTQLLTHCHSLPSGSVCQSGLPPRVVTWQVCRSSAAHCPPVPNDVSQPGPPWTATHHSAAAGKKVTVQWGGGGGGGYTLGPTINQIEVTGLNVTDLTWLA